MRRFFLATALSSHMQIKGEDAHHINHVLRLQTGNNIIVVDHNGQAGIAEIAHIAGDAVELSLQQIIGEHKEPPIEVCLAQGLPKGDKMEYIVQKAVELGVSRLIPLSTERSIVKYDSTKQIERVKRWQKIAVEAAKQCGRTNVPVVEPVQSLKQVLTSSARDTVVLMLYEGQAQQGLKDALAHCPASSYLLLIGPEGGFSQKEVNLCRDFHTSIVTMGPRILRAETAAVAALTIVMYQCGDLGGV